MKHDETLPTVARIYVSVVITAGLSVVGLSLYALHLDPVSYHWSLLAGLTLLSGSFTIRIPTIPARLSVSETFVFAAVLLFGPAAATMVVVLDSLVISLWQTRRSQSFSRVLFNMAAPSIAIWTASNLFFLLAAVRPLSRSPRPILPLLGPLVVLAIVYFLLNSFLIALAVAFEKRLSAYDVWRNNFFWLSLNYFSGASVAALLLPYLQPEQPEFARVVGILLPLLLISYLTFKTAMGRVDDANRHLTELNRLYLSTIETLAMAIDAKDQITHGHIRRVQLRAIRLAHAMGVTDEPQIRAIEAAALLHDMGKLAVPEYILNKPGPLTPPEFEKMKLHAGIGADILSAIQFPYPVVPIVRHHHENWDGTGYPSALSGSEIPIGARILSVVDCFDALTSDRPYRPKLSDTDALNIISARRGTMYDPLVVDTFLRAHAAGELLIDSVQTDALQAVVDFSRDPEATPALPHSGLEDITSSSEEMLALFEMARELSKSVTVDGITNITLTHLRRMIPSSLFCVYVRDARSDDIVCVKASGKDTHLVNQLRIPIGHRLTGWVVANLDTIRNSDPILDLGEPCRSVDPRLTSCLSTPLINEATAVGALSLYSSAPYGFTKEQQRLLDVVAAQVAPALLNARDRVDFGIFAESTTNTSRARAGNQALSKAIASPTVLIYLKFNPIEGQHSVVDSHISEAIRLWLADEIAPRDLMLRLRNDEFVVLRFNACTISAAQSASIIHERFDLFASSADQLTSLQVTSEVVSAPVDGDTLEDLVESARRRVNKHRSSDDGSASIH